jgi:hypothetical protein
VIGTWRQIRSRRTAAVIVSRIVIEALRDAPGPLTTTELTRRVMTARGLDMNDVALTRTMSQRVGACLNHWRRKRGAVRSMPGPGKCWRGRSCDKFQSAGLI